MLLSSCLYSVSTNTTNRQEYNFCQTPATMITLASSHFINVTSLDPGFPQDGAGIKVLKHSPNTKQQPAAAAVGPVLGLIKTPETNYCN